MVILLSWIFALMSGLPDIERIVTVSRRELHMFRDHRTLGLRSRSHVMLAFKWSLGVGYLWDWLLAVAVIIINFTIPGSVIPAVKRIIFDDDPSLRYPTSTSWLSEEQKFPVELGVPLLVVALVQLKTRSLVDW